MLYYSKTTGCTEQLNYIKACNRKGAENTESQAHKNTWLFFHQNFKGKKGLEQCRTASSHPVWYIWQISIIIERKKTFLGKKPVKIIYDHKDIPKNTGENSSG